MSDPWGPAGQEPTTPAYRPPYGTPSQPGYGAPPPPRGGQPGYGGQQPGYGGQQPGYGGQQPGYGGQQPGYGGQQPGYGGQSGGYGAPAPYPAPQQQSPYGAQPVSPNPYGYGTPPKKRTGARIAIISVIVVAVAAAVFVVAKVAKDNAGKAGGTSTSTSNLSIPLGDGTKLLAAVLPPPAGSKVETPKNSANGVMTLDQFLTNFFDGDSDERGRLQDRGFSVAVQRGWLDRATNVETDLQLVQFKTVDGAHQHLLGQEGAYDSDTTMTGSYDITGVKGGRGYENSTPDDNGDHHATLIAQDRNVVIVLFIFTPGSFDRAAESSIISRQVAALDKLG